MAWSGSGLESVTRRSADFDYTVLINHADSDRSVELTGRELVEGSDIAGALTVPAGSVRIVRQRRSRTQTA